MNASLSIVTTADGSHSLHLNAVGEGYHSVEGAVSEARHVYLQPNLLRQLACNAAPVEVFEMGFGTGLNALLTLIEAERSHHEVLYTTVEAHPLPVELCGQLNYAQKAACPFEAEEVRGWFVSLHGAPWGEWCRVSPYFSLRKLLTPMQAVALEPCTYHSVFYDAFAPQYQPELWTSCIFSTLWDAMRSEAVLTTYCCKGDVKRALKSAGFTIEKLPGFGRKREMLRAVKVPQG